VVASLAVLLLNGQVSARTVDVGQASIADIQKAFAAGTLTSEKLVELCLARIKAYDRQGPALHAIITLNPNALEQARILDAERKTKGPRSVLHGIPVVLKDNFDTADMPTTGGSVLLKGAQPKEDATLVKKLRDAGAIILAKVNLSEFATAGNFSSLGGQSRNPHDPARSPMGSSGGTGVSVAAGFAPLGMGSDTGGSVRLPASANGIVGIRPSRGLLSRSGIIPLSLSFDTGGPLARSVLDVATALTVLQGVDPTDEVTKLQQGQVPASYLTGLRADALKGARIGIARDFMGFDPDVDWAMESAVHAMQKAGATVVGVRFPAYMLSFLDIRAEFMAAVRFPESAAQISAYLAKTGPGYPKSLNELIDRAYAYNGTGPDGERPNPGRWLQFTKDVASGEIGNYRYVAVHDYGLAMVKTLVGGALAADKLDAIVYPVQSVRTPLIAASPDPPGYKSPPSGTLLASITGFPDVSLPAGFTGNGLPVGMGMLGPGPFTESRLLALAYSFEQATHSLRQPAYTPPLAGGSFDVP
jgi:amidase